VELFRRDTEEEEEEEHHHNNREFTNALREALRDVSSTMNKRLERVKKMTDYVAVASWGGEKKRLKPGSAASTRRITKPLKDWMYENVHHPYPSRKEKMVLSQATGMSPGQISNWCINFRGRKMRPLVREFVEEARKVVQK